jgi:transposase
MAYSVDFIKRAVAYKQEGHTFKQLEEAFNIPPVTYYDWVEKLDIGHFDVKVKRERNRKIDKDALKLAVLAKPDAFLREYAEQFNCTPTAIFYALENLDITRKKRLLHIQKNRMKKEKILPKS